MPVLTFGKHAGKDLQDVPEEYLEWLIDERRKEIEEYKAELARRSDQNSQQQWMRNIIQTGYRTLAKTLHPDLAGSNELFLALSSAKEELERRIS